MGVQAARIVFPPADRAEIAAAITEILTSGNLTLGPYTQRFEADFAAAHGGAGPADSSADPAPADPAPGDPARSDPAQGGPAPGGADPARSGASSSPRGGEPALNAVAVSSGTAALEISLRVLGVAGRDVIVPANTFYATAAAVLRAGARPVFADIDPATFALSPRTVTAALTPGTAAVVLVHIGGLITPQVSELRQLCDERGITLVEDAAHAHGCAYDGKYAGSFGSIAAFSFYPTKVVTSGEGGMILTASAELAAEARIYRDQGKGAFGANHHIREGYAWRMSEQNAATGLVHLRRLGEFIARRRAVAARYDKGLAPLDGLDPVAEPPAAAATSISTSRSCRPGRSGPGSSSSWPAGSGCGWPARSTTCRCTISPCSPRTRARRCRWPRTCARGTSACRSIPT